MQLRDLLEPTNMGDRFRLRQKLPEPAHDFLHSEWLLGSNTSLDDR